MKMTVKGTERNHIRYSTYNPEMCICEDGIEEVLFQGTVQGVKEDILKDNFIEGINNSFNRIIEKVILWEDPSEEAREELTKSGFVLDEIQPDTAVTFVRFNPVEDIFSDNGFSTVWEEMKGVYRENTSIHLSKTITSDEIDR